MELAAILDLTPRGADTFVGTGPRYPWGGLYGGQIVAQALRAAAATLGDPELQVHSLRAYFLRLGDHSQPVRYEVDRLRDGRSFATRRVVAQQAVGAILNLEASFQRPEAGRELSPLRAPAVPGPDELEQTSWSPVFERAFVAPNRVAGGATDGAGRAVAWLRLAHPAADDPLAHACGLAYLSDDLPTDAVVRALRADGAEEPDEGLFTASLDHTMWFHRPLRADRWHLHDFRCHAFVGGRGLALGHVFGDDGTHLATVAQEVLLRRKR